MIARLRRVSTATVLALMVVTPALGQSDQPWIDPPASALRPAQAPSNAPDSEMADVGTTGATPVGSSREQAARQLAVDYLDFWSAPNALTLEVMPRFYSQRVDFHGRSMSAEAVIEEKRRFVRRWPVRSYTAQIDTLRASCAPGTQTCAVKGLFAFTATDPRRGRRSQGAADLELQVTFEGERPTIIAETSRVIARGRTREGAALDDIED